MQIRIIGTQIGDAVSDSMMGAGWRQEFPIWYARCIGGTFEVKRESRDTLRVVSGERMHYCVDSRDAEVLN